MTTFVSLRAKLHVHPDFVATVQALFDGHGKGGNPWRRAVSATTARRRAQDVAAITAFAEQDNSIFIPRGVLRDVPAGFTVPDGFDPASRVWSICCRAPESTVTTFIETVIPRVAQAVDFCQVLRDEATRRKDWEEALECFHFARR